MQLERVEKVDPIASRVLKKETFDAMEAIPDLVSTLMNNEVSWDDEAENEHVESVFSEIRMSEIPIGVISGQEATKCFLDWSMLKSCANYEPKVIKAVEEYLQDATVENLFEALFWIVNILKFQPENIRLLRKLRKQLSIHYTRTLAMCLQPKESVLSLLKFSLAYMVHAMHYKIFSKHRSNFTVRFVLDCYHIVIFELTGLLISDVYIHHQLEKIFGFRFFLFKQEGILGLTEIDIEDGSKFAKIMKVDKKDIERLKVNGDVLTENAKRDVINFGHQLTEKFAKNSKILNANSKTNLLLAKYEGEFAKKMMEVTEQPNYQEIMVNRARKINESKLREEEDEPVAPQSMVDSKVFNYSSVDNESSLKLKSKSTASLPLLKVKQKFDCSQVSPPLRGVANSIISSLPKKSVMITSFNVPDFSIAELENAWDKFHKKDVKKDEKKVKKRNSFLENKIKYGYGSEELNFEGLSQALRDKFTEFYIIKNVRPLSFEDHQ